MSAETKAALVKAIEEHFADEMDGDMVQGWVLQISGGSLDTYGQRYLRSTPVGQPLALSYGLAGMCHNKLAAEVAGMRQVD